jgi:beta-glucanase (GH16 family)
VPETTSPSRSHHLRRTTPIAVLAVLALVFGALALVPRSGAGADSTVVAQVAGATDSGAIDLNHDGVADLGMFGTAKASLSVGEQMRDGSDLRLFLPFTVSANMLHAVHSGGSANVSLQVRRVSHLGSHRLVIDGYTNGTTAHRADFSRGAKRLGKLTPVVGRLAVDVSSLLRAMKNPGTLVVRLRLNHAAAVDGVSTQVNIATSETRPAKNRPLLSTSTLRAAATTTVPTNAPAPSPTTQPASTQTTQPAPPSTDPPAAHELFRDDFNGSTLDTSKWRPNWLAGSDDTVTKPVNSAELSCYDPAQVSVSGGYLHLNAVDRPCRASNGVTYPYASGLVESADHFTFTYGRVEARIFIPANSGAAANWPAFWANGTGTWPVTGELDVMEGLEGHACWHFHSTAGGPGGCAPWPNPTGWHTFAAEWAPGSVTYFYDGQQIGRVASGITGSPMYLVLNLGVSTSISPPVRLPSEMLVDWVRVTR